MKKSILVFLFVFVLAAGLIPAVAAEGESPQFWLSQYDFSPLGSGDWTYLQLYYGTSEEQILLTAGTLTSSNENIISVEKMEDEDDYRIYPKEFGSATLTYTDGDVTYTADVTVSIPWRAFYTAREIKGANYIYSDYILPRNTDTTLWLMSEEGFYSFEVQDLSAAIQGDNGYEKLTSGVAVTAVPRSDDTDTTYDIK